MRYAIVESGKVVNVAESDKPLAENWIQSDNAEVGFVYNEDETFTQPQKTRVEIIEMIASRRYAEEVRGITVNGAFIKTDPVSQGKIIGAALATLITPNKTRSWKAGGGFVQINDAAIVVIAQAVDAHVQGCFDREAELLAEVDNGTFTESMLDEGWTNG